MDLLKKYVPQLLLSCRSSTELMAKAEVVPLTLKEQFLLWFHKMNCRTCRDYEKQSDVIGRVIQNRKPPVGPVLKLSEEQMKKILDRLKELS
jgi:hypothetical protein